MGKRPLGGNLTHHAGAHHRDHGARRCLGCHRPIIWGPDRCPPCTRELVARRRRKRR